MKPSTIARSRSNRKATCRPISADVLKATRPAEFVQDNAGKVDRLELIYTHGDLSVYLTENREFVLDSTVGYQEMQGGKFGEYRTIRQRRIVTPEFALLHILLNLPPELAPHIEKISAELLKKNA